MKIAKYLLIAAVAAFTLAACDKNDNPSSGKPSTETPDEEPTQDPEDDAVIVIDGDFADWDAAPNIAIAECPDDAAKGSLLVMKFTSDEKFIYAYFEQLLEDGQAMSPFDLFLDIDNNPETGASCYLWDPCGWDYLIESEKGFLASATAVQDMDDMALYKFIGPDGEDGWADPDPDDEDWAPYQERTEESGFASSAGVVKSGVAKVEVAIDRSIFGKLGKKIAVGILLYDGPDWNDNGVLPQGEAGALDSLLEVEL